MKAAVKVLEILASDIWRLNTAAMDDTSQMLLLSHVANNSYKTSSPLHYLNRFPLLFPSPDSIFSLAATMVRIGMQFIIIYHSEP